MKRKNLISCSVVLILLLIANLFIFSTVPQKPEHPSIPAKMPESNTEPSASKFANSYTFANEKVPAEIPKVAARMERMLRKHQYDHLQTHKLHRKAAQWFPVIEPILELYGIPEDFKYLPLVESGLKGGTSHKGASGSWQFMPQTARGFGLRVGGGVDERHNFRKSTVAACKYLRELYDEFGSWTLAAAAYNIGENRLRRLMSRQKQDDYFRMRLNQETATFVYRLVSMKEIIEKPHMYGYSVPEPEPDTIIHTGLPNIQRYISFAELGMLAYQKTDN